jgi:esterase
MARLHHERIAAEAAPPAHWLVLTHGIFGAGSNWRSIARKLTRARPDLGCVLVDLRNHGRSPLPPPPHDLAACADDLGELIEELGQAGEKVIAAAGHSFGGKVVATLRQRRGGFAHAGGIGQWWMLDSSPSARPLAWTQAPNSVRDVLAILESLPATLPNREMFETALISAGRARPLAQWLALNLESDGRGALRLRLPLPAIRDMLESYFETDLWAELVDPSSGEVHVVVAERSTTVSPADRERLRHPPPHLVSHAVDADHWLHIDAPDAVVTVLAEWLPFPVAHTTPSHDRRMDGDPRDGA